jgi:hypothetical protein
MSNRERADELLDKWDRGFDATTDIRELIIQALDAAEARGRESAVKRLLNESHSCGPDCLHPICKAAREARESAMQERLEAVLPSEEEFKAWVKKETAARMNMGFETFLASPDSCATHNWLKSRIKLVPVEGGLQERVDHAVAELAEHCRCGYTLCVPCQVRSRLTPEPRKEGEK